MSPLGLLLPLAGVCSCPNPVRIKTPLLAERLNSCLSFWDLCAARPPRRSLIKKANFIADANFPSGTTGNHPNRKSWLFLIKGANQRFEDG